ncbi:MAG: hypothetical protein K8S87_07280, partial [Planctomycetes bacterium]|nr:hypothetical protein [Planctomycetota bacterium]
MSFNNNQKSDTHSITPFEVFVIIAFMFLVITVIFSVNIETDDNSTHRLQLMNNDELWAIVNSEDFDDSIKTKAFDRLSSLEQSDKMMVRAYEMLYDPAYNAEELVVHAEHYVKDNPTQILAQRIVNDYINNAMSDRLWLMIRGNWAKILLPQAFSNAQLLFKGIKENEKRRFSFVIDVLSLDNNSYLIEVVDKYLGQSKTFRNPELTEKIADGLFKMKLNQADDVIRIAVKIIINNEISNDFAGFSSKIENITKKFAHTEDIRNRLEVKLSEIKTGRWIPVKNSLLNWMKNLEK